MKKGIHIKSRLDECKKFDELQRKINFLKSKKINITYIEHLDIPEKLLKAVFYK